MRRWLPHCLLVLGLLLSVVLPYPQPLLMKGGTEAAFAEHRLMMVRIGVGLLMIIAGLIWLLVRVPRRQ